MKVFLSCVSSEFRSYRLKLANQLGALKGQTCDVKVQEDFNQGGFTLLDKLADYILECDLVIHLVGDACGARPSAEHVSTMFAHLGVPAPVPLPDRSYTQWEYELAIRFGRRMFCYFATPAAPRDCGPSVEQSDAVAQLQRDHRERIQQSGKHYGTFSGHLELVRQSFDDLGLQAELKINNLPYKSLGSLFKGREDFLEQLRRTLGEAEHLGHQKVAAITATAAAATVHGLGGIGKTRAALEFAHRFANEYTALLFVRADSPASLQQNLASLCGPMVLDLPEKEAKETDAQLAAVLDWLQRHPGWFLILDNVDTEEAAIAVQPILARLSSAGQVVITSRLSNWEGAVEALALDVLTVEAATEFLLERTESGRRNQPDDPARARVLAVELGQLALALEQAGAYIVRYKEHFAGYLEEWRQRHDQVLDWFDERTMQYPRSVAVTWQTSFDRLSEQARLVLRLLSWLAPNPIPESLFEADASSSDGVGGSAPSEGEVRIPDARDVLAELANHSLLRRSDEEPMFSVHRLVQDVTRRTLPETEQVSYLTQALQLVDRAFQGDPWDVRAWPILEPLAPHAKAIVAFADERRVAAPTTRLMSSVGLLLNKKAQFVDAEPLLRRALAIDEGSYGPNHHIVAVHLNNLAQLLETTDRMAEAEPMMRRALAIDEQSCGPNHPVLAVRLSNLAQLLVAANRLTEAEPLLRRALAIEERSYGPDHPGVAIRLGNLAQLLQITNRMAEAELLLRRALAIDERSYGPDHPTVATGLSNVAQLLLATNQLAQAEPMMLRALSIDERSYGPDHPDVAIRLNNLAQLLQITNRMAEAEPMMRRALAIDERSYGPHHPIVADRLNNLALLLQVTHRLKEAEPLYRRGLEILDHFRERTGREHPSLINLRTNYNSLRVMIGIGYIPAIFVSLVKKMVFWRRWD